MKRQYNKPTLKVVKLDMTKMLTASGSINSNLGIGYGGTDTGGVMIPE